MSEQRMSVHCFFSLLVINDLVKLKFCAFARKQEGKVLQLWQNCPYEKPFMRFLYSTFEPKNFHNIVCPRLPSFDPTFPSPRIWSVWFPVLHLHSVCKIVLKTVNITNNIKNLSEQMQNHCSHCTTAWRKMRRENESIPHTDPDASRWVEWL